MSSNRKRPLAEEWTADKWYRSFFSECRLSEEDAESYAVIFAQNGMRLDLLSLLNKDLLKEMKIVKVGHIIEILRVAQQVSSQEQRSEISHSATATPPQSKVINLKSVVKLKDSRTRKESEVGGIKKDISNIKRTVPDEGPTLSVKMPSRVRLTSPSQDESPSKVARPSVSAQSVDEVSSSTEKKQKKSVFERLGSSKSTGNNAQTSSSGPTVQSTVTVQVPPSPGILKKTNNTTTINKTNFKSVSSPKFGPASLSPPEIKRPQSPGGGLTLKNGALGVTGSTDLPNSRSFLRQRSRSPGQRSLSPRPRSLSPGQNKMTTVEPSFHVTMATKLINPFVTKVLNQQPIIKQSQDRNNASGPSLSRSGNSVSSTSNNKSYFGSMAADQIELDKGLALDQRLGNRKSWPVGGIESNGQKKRVSFGNVRTKEIPAMAGTQRFNSNPSIVSKQLYSGSIALRTAKKL